MRLAFVLYKSFPFGGLQCDMLRIAKVCREAGYQLQARLVDTPADRVVGFNKVPGGDGYHAADGCVRERLLAERGRRRK
jgi:UDP-glucose:(heptosyl)LPS alpha-1,3-glucosyltransferase